MFIGLDLHFGSLKIQHCGLETKKKKNWKQLLFSKGTKAFNLN